MYDIIHKGDYSPFFQAVEVGCFWMGPGLFIKLNMQAGNQAYSLNLRLWKESVHGSQLMHIF